jgi:hypothetical protein
MYEIDPSKSTDELLQQIRTGAQASNRANPNLPLPPFAALLVRLSRDADTTAEKNLKIQRNLIWLTIAILLLTVSMFAVQVIQYLQGR